MNPICTIVAERTALGEELGEHLAHTTTCARCKHVVALPGKLAATAHAADPGMGFASRMTAGAQHRIVVRRRQRYAAVTSVALAATVVIAMFAVRGSSDDSSVAYVPVELLPHLPATNPVVKEDPWKPHEPGKLDEDVRALVHLANVDRSRHVSAHWGRIEKSLAPYRGVLKGTEP